MILDTFNSVQRCIEAQICYIGIQAEERYNDIRDEDSEEETEGVEAEFSGTLHKGGKGDDSTIDQETSRDWIEPRSIDAYWLQRELNKAYGDHMLSKKKAEDVLDILQVYWINMFSFLQYHLDLNY